MKNNGGYKFSLLTLMLLFTGISLGFLWWQDRQGLCKRIALEKQNQRVILFEVQPRVLGFTIYSKEDDYVFELSKKEMALGAKLAQGELDFIALVQFIGCWEAAIENPKNYDKYQKDCKNCCYNLNFLLDAQEQHPVRISVSPDQVEFYDKFYEDCFPFAQRERLIEFENRQR